MINLAFNNISISGISCCVPKEPSTLDKYETIFGREAIEKFKLSTGINQRYLAKKAQTSSDLAYVAAKNLLERERERERESIGILVFISQTPDYRLPATAYVLQHRLKLSRDCICFDVNHGCSGYIYGLGIVASIMANSNIKNGLLLTGDTISRYSAPKDSSVCMLMGDAGTATLLSKDDKAPKLDISYQSDGTDYQAVIIPSGAARNVGANHEREIWDRDGNERSDYELLMDGMQVFSYAFSKAPRFIREYLEKSQKSFNDFDAIVMHQANRYLMQQILKKVGFPQDKALVSIDRFANTSVNSIPLSIVDAYAKNESYHNELIKLLLCGFGGGMSLGIADIKLLARGILPMLYSDEYYTEGGVSHD